MRYLSLFSGIGGFEVAIDKVYGKRAVCVGFSEIDKHAIEEYSAHYPDHRNLGNIVNLKKKDIDVLGRIDMVVGGFPCNDLSSANLKGRLGLDGDKSGLFWTMLKVLKWVLKENPDLKIVIENNASMANKWKDIITNELTKVFKRDVYCNYFDSMQWVMQRRRRYYWTLTPIPEYKGKRLYNMRTTLDPPTSTNFEPLSETIITYFNQNPFKGKGHSFILSKSEIDKVYSTVPVNTFTRWKTRHSSSKDEFIRCINTQVHDNSIFDYRLVSNNVNNDYFVPRYLTKSEMCRCFGYPPNYVATNKKTIYTRLYGMTVVPPVIAHILKYV